MSLVYRVVNSLPISGSNVAINVMHLQLGGMPTTAEQTSMLTKIKPFYDASAADRVPGAQWNIGAQQLIFDTTQWVKPTFDANHKVVTPGHFSSEQAIGSGTPQLSTIGSGSAGGPQQVAAVVSWKTGFAGRSTRGRTYLGPLSGNDTVSVTLPGAAQSRFQVAATALIAAIPTATVAAAPPTMVIWSPTKGTFTNVLSAFVGTAYATMRSRLR